MNCVYFLNILQDGQSTDFVTSKARQSIVSACRRWGCNLYEILQPTPGKCLSHSKYTAVQHLSGFCKLLYLDSDVVISSDAPSPFDLVTRTDALYVVSDYQAANQTEQWKYLVGTPMRDIILRHPGFKIPSWEQYFNNGFMLFSTLSNVASLFRRQTEFVLEDFSGRVWDIRDQSLLNILAYNEPGLSVELLPETWNHIVQVGAGPSNECFINHYAGIAQSLLSQG